MEHSSRINLGAAKCLPSRMPTYRRTIKVFFTDNSSGDRPSAGDCSQDRIKRDPIYRDCNDWESEATEEVSMIGRVVLAEMKK